jgi:adenylate cyclase
MKELAAIMMTDIVGFTKLTRQEESLVKQINTRHETILQDAISRHHGRLIHIFRDNSLSIFGAPDDAVNCAIAIQQAVCLEPAIPLRIAVHYDEVKTEGELIFGDGINVASRILKLAIASCVLISDHVKELLRPETDIEMRSIGIHELKHVDQPVEIFGICQDDLVLPETHETPGEGPIRAGGPPGKGERILAAIMFTDIVGYTALMQENEQKAMQDRDRHKGVLLESIERHHGKILQYYGDGTLSIFHSTIEAIDCAIRIQSILQEEPKIPLRIGVHSGDIAYDNEGIYGDGVNVASRIEGLAVAGSVLISGKVFDDIKNHPSISAVSLGSFELKNVRKPLDVYAISNKGLAVPTRKEVRSKGREKENSLAILPFVNMSPDPENEFFSDGISEAIINALTQVEGLFVTARTSSFAFKGQNKDIRELGKLLGVVYILEGSVQRYRDQIRVTAQLIDTVSGFHIFSEAYNRELIDVFSIQDDIAWLIAQKLKEKINLEDKALLSSPRTSNIQALDLYIKGQNKMNTGAHPNILEAMELFQQSIDLDPDFVLPYGAICKCYIFLGMWGFMDSELSNRKSREYALKALEKDPTHPTSLTAYAMISLWNDQWDFKEFESALGNAMKMAPGAAEVRMFQGLYHLMTGNLDGALTEFLLAKKLDPINPNILTRLGYTYICLEEFEKARDYLWQAHNLAHLDLYFQYILAWSYLIERRYDKADTELGKVDEARDGYQLKHGTAGYLHAIQGRPGKAHEEINYIRSQEAQGNMKFPNFNYALVYAGLNDPEKMFHHLREAIAERPISLLFIRVDPVWNAFRQDPRYTDLLDRIFNTSP